MKKIYVVTVKDTIRMMAGSVDPFLLSEVAGKIKNIIKTETEPAHMVDLFPSTGTLTLLCNEAFAKKVEKLPFVAVVEREERPSRQKPKP